MNYARSIRIARTSRGLSQIELAKSIGKTPGYVSKIEAGDRKPAVEVLEAMAETLNIPLYLLMLIGSEKRDLNGASTQEVNRVGELLLGTLLDAGSSSQ